nr:hypothetical protein [Tanacetum cinerariifolium]
MGRWTGRGGGRIVEPQAELVVKLQLQDLLPTIIAQVGNYASNINGDVRNVNVGNGRNGCSYKEFLTCNPKDYNGKGGAIVYTHWIKKIESAQDMRGCEANQKVKYTVNSFIGKALTWWNTQKLETEFWCHAIVEARYGAYTDRFHNLARLVPHLVTPKNKRIKRYIYCLGPQIRVMVAAIEPTTIQSAMLKARMLISEAIRNGSLKKNTEKRGNGRELSRKENIKADNKRSRTGRAFATITNPFRKEYMGHFARDCRAEPRMVTPVSDRNLMTARGVCFECVVLITTRPPALGSRGSLRDPNIVAGTFTLINYYATTLFDSGADYSFGSTTFIPLLDIEPSDLGFSYEIKIASEQLVEIIKVIRDCKLEIEGQTFDIDWILFGYMSFYVIVGMECLSRHKAKIIFHKKVVRIPLPHSEILRFLGEKPEEKVRYLMSAKTKEQKLKDFVVVRSYPEVSPNDLSVLPPS